MYQEQKNLIFVSRIDAGCLVKLLDDDDSSGKATNTGLLK